MFLKFKDMSNLEITVDTEKITHTRQLNKSCFQIFIQGSVDVEPIYLDKKLYQVLMERLEPVPLIEK